jgi:DNA-binding MarR family transcriptional regulator
MNARKRSASEDTLTALIVEVFRLNGCLLEAGDSLVGDVGLTSARWQVLGAIAATDTPLPVAHLARNMGLTRQAVQRVANELERDGLIRFAPNPHHERAKLVLLTDTGSRAFGTAMRRQAPWATRLGKGLRPTDLETTLRVVAHLRRRLEEDSAL